MSRSSRSNGPALNRRDLLRLSTVAGVGAVLPTYGALANVKGGSGEVPAVGALKRVKCFRGLTGGADYRERLQSKQSQVRPGRERTGNRHRLVERPLQLVRGSSDGRSLLIGEDLSSAETVMRSA